VFFLKKDKQQPDFKELNDRLIAEAPQGPFLAIRTNLDTDDTLTENPYLNEVSTNQDKEEIRDFFNEE
jgi:hypothetical protein